MQMAGTRATAIWDEGIETKPSDTYPINRWPRGCEQPWVVSPARDLDRGPPLDITPTSDLEIFLPYQAVGQGPV